MVKNTAITKNGGTLTEIYAYMLITLMEEKTVNIKTGQKMELYIETGTTKETVES